MSEIKINGGEIGKRFGEWWNTQGRLFMAGNDVHAQRAVMGVAERAWFAASRISNAAKSLEDCRHCDGIGCKSCLPKKEEEPAKVIDWGVDPYAPMEAVMHACGLLDVIKQEWGDQWTEHDQKVRAGLSAMLVAPSPIPSATGHTF